MAKTTVTNITTTVKRLIDYDITDTALDNLILEALNLFLPTMGQWFFDASMLDEITAHDTITTTASQEYVELGTETVDFDQAVVLTERTNDQPIEIITFKEYRERFPDPTANSQATPDVAAFFANRIYFGPTPSGAISIFLDYYKLLTVLNSNSSLPFENKFNSLVTVGVIEWLVKWLDRGNANMIDRAEKDVEKYRHRLITGAAVNIGMNQQTQSRREQRPFFAPRKVI